MGKGLASPTIKIGGETVKTVPNSAKLKYGSGEKNVRAEAAGNNISIVTTVDLETRISEFTLEIYNTSEQIKLAKKWATLDNIIISISEGDWSETLDAVLTSDINVSLSSDGMIELIFKGTPIQ